MIILKIVLFTYIVSFYVVTSYNNSDKLIFKIFDIAAAIILLATIIYSIVKVDIPIIFGIITGFAIAIKLIFDKRK